MQVDISDYILINIDDKKPKLGLVNKIRKDKIYGNFCIKTIGLEPEDYKFIIRKEDIVSNLSDTPKIGNSYGLEIEPYYKSYKISGFAEIDFYIKVNKKQFALIIKAFHNFYNWLKKNNMITHLPIEIEIRPNKGKQYGKYIHYINKDDKLDKVIIRLNEYEESILNYVIAHEMGHHIKFNYINKDFISKWIKIYYKSVLIDSIDLNDLKSLRKEFEKNCSNIYSWKKDLDENDREIYKLCLKHIKNVHSLQERDLIALAENEDNLREFWPNTILKSTVELIISDYGKKNVDEYWAECFAFWYSKIEMPKECRKLVMNTITSIINEYSTELEDIKIKKKSKKSIKKVA